MKNHISGQTFQPVVWFLLQHVVKISFLAISFELGCVTDASVPTHFNLFAKPVKFSYSCSFFALVVVAAAEAAATVVVIVIVVVVAVAVMVVVAVAVLVK